MGSFFNLEESDDDATIERKIEEYLHSLDLAKNEDLG
jgi:hypothetical protein